MVSSVATASSASQDHARACVVSGRDLRWIDLRGRVYIFSSLVRKKYSLYQFFIAGQHERIVSRFAVFMAIQLLIMSAPMIVDIDLTLDLSILTARKLVVKNDRW